MFCIFLHVQMSHVHFFCFYTGHLFLTLTFIFVFGFCFDSSDLTVYAYTYSKTPLLSRIR